MHLNKKAAGPNVDELNATHISESRVVYRRVCVFVVYLFKAVQKNTHSDIQPHKAQAQYYYFIRISLDILHAIYYGTKKNNKRP